MEKSLGECAEIFRCPLAREKITDERAGCWDISRDCFCTLTGFVDLEKGKKVSVNITERTRKYFLRPNDILMTHVGAAERIGEVGLVVGSTEYAVPGQSLCVIRAKDVEPVWLFYLLMQSKKEISDIVTPLSPKARPLSSVVLNIKKLRSFPIPLPDQTEIDAICSAHTKILESKTIILKEANKINDEHIKMSNLFKKS